jgi:prephenate dehydrogenase
MNNIFIIGVGLIGGSFALDIKKLYPKSNVFGIDKREAHLDEAINLYSNSCRCNGKRFA